MQHDIHLYDRAEALLADILRAPRSRTIAATVCWLLKLTTIGVAL